MQDNIPLLDDECYVIYFDHGKREDDDIFYDRVRLSDCRILHPKLEPFISFTRHPNYKDDWNVRDACKFLRTSKFFSWNLRPKDNSPNRKTTHQRYELREVVDNPNACLQCKKSGNTATCLVKEGLECVNCHWYGFKCSFIDANKVEELINEPRRSRSRTASSLAEMEEVAEMAENEGYEVVIGDMIIRGTSILSAESAGENKEGIVEGAAVGAEGEREASEGEDSAAESDEERNEEDGEKPKGRQKKTAKKKVVEGTFQS